MKAFVAKTALACSLAAASLFGASAQAAVFPDFTVDPINTAQANFVADKITGNYVEVATFNGDGTFDVSLLWTAGQFASNDGSTTLTSFRTGLGSTYQMYALYKASGTVSTDGFKTTFNFTSGTGTLQMFLDTQFDTDLENGITQPGSGSGNFAIVGAGNDTVIATGEALAGQGTLDPTLSTCTNGAGGSGINCGSFGSTTSFDLTAAGKLFFVAPSPFFNLSFQSGQLNNFDPSGTQVINGSLDVTFGNAVPEPGSIALLGMGLLGLGMARRRKQQ
jgi:hypothetical protein